MEGVCAYESFERVTRRATPELLISRRHRARTEAAGNAEEGPPAVRGEDSRPPTLGRTDSYLEKLPIVALVCI